MKGNRLLIGLIFFAMILLAGCTSKASKDVLSEIEEKPITVETGKAIVGSIESTVSYSGRIKPIQEIMITPKQPGKVMKINFDLGQRVKTGQVLFQLDKTDVSLQLNQAAIAVELGEINLKRISGSTYEQQMIQLKTALSSAEINYNDANANFETIKILYEAGGESKFNYDRAESQYKLAKEQYENAMANYKLLEEKSSLENIELAQAQLKQSKAAYNIALNALNNMDVKSPIDGVISGNNLKVGEFISNATVAFVIIDDSSYTIDINVSENVIGKIQTGDKVKVYIGSISEKTLIGTVTAVAPSADMQKQTYTVKVTLEEPPDTVKGGMFAEVKFATDSAENSIVVPLSSVIKEEEKNYVFVVYGNKVKKTEIAAGIYNDKEIQILDGIAADDVIVTKGQDFLKDGSTIVITNK
ncbi:MAG: efflux RND transporter periplasmic adaptor subunit [Firmicutes bacterium]|nr:efflux RND transporter periplasmic adaptor subunit [Bacillota bacterium]